MKFSVKKMQNENKLHSHGQRKNRAALNKFQKFLAWLRLRKAINMADEAHAKNGERYYVMPSSSSKSELIIMDRRNFRILKNKYYITSEARVRDLVAESFYFTPYKNGYGYMPAEIRRIKMEQYFRWCEGKLNGKK
ncbi:hypothetical protein OCV73_02560 [Barnesiella propionica]|uniref:hypothetical protein n=1 Tax=Barnesiella propionica TaxID=2981781 RepID=UPI0021CEA124|nr:hypothetical protein [Barnesiella propionica]MCU6767840.1 hypothetical protein [Barnesiella propionica]